MLTRSFGGNAGENRGTCKPARVQRLRGNCQRALLIKPSNPFRVIVSLWPDNKELVPNFANITFLQAEGT